MVVLGRPAVFFGATGHARLGVNVDDFPTLCTYGLEVLDYVNEVVNLLVLSKVGLGGTTELPNPFGVVTPFVELTGQAEPVYHLFTTFRFIATTGGAFATIPIVGARPDTVAAMIAQLRLLFVICSGLGH